MSTLQSFVEQGWNEHGDAPQALAERLHDGLGLVQTPADVSALAALAHHVHGTHLGQWTQGLAFLMALNHRAGGLVQGEAEADVQRFAASLTLCKGHHDTRASLSVSDRIRVTAMASASLAAHDPPRALALMSEALQVAATSGLPDSDPMNRALAVTGNNLAATLEEQPTRSAAERALMIAAAETGRAYWEKAGTWLHIERAEYRLAHTWLKAGDPEQAKGHALHCLHIVQTHGNEPLEVFFGHEALVEVERARGDEAAAQASLAQMRDRFEQLAPDDRDACRTVLERLAGSAAAA